MRAWIALLAISFAAPLITPMSGQAAVSTLHQRRWVHHADMDGDGIPDRIVITADKDLKIDQFNGSGHYTLHVRLSSTGKVLSERFAVTDYNNLPAKRWSPWFGSADIDHVGGREILLGDESGASSSQFYVIVYSRGRLRALPSPDGAWGFNSDVDESNGFRCTADGIEARGFGMVGRGFDHWVVDRDYFVWHDNAWHRTKRVHRRIRSKHEPRGTRGFGAFQCRGLAGGVG
jgi:hypothetical protein